MRCALRTDPVVKASTQKNVHAIGYDVKSDRLMTCGRGVRSDGMWRRLCVDKKGVDSWREWDDDNAGKIVALGIPRPSYSVPT